jgi:chromate transport protein ChrA
MRDQSLPLDHGIDMARPFGDAVSLGVVVATIAEWLPSVAALLTVVWTAIRIYETKTVQRLIGRAGD